MAARVHTVGPAFPGASLRPALPLFSEVARVRRGAGGGRRGNCRCRGPLGGAKRGDIGCSRSGMGELKV